MRNDDAKFFNLATYSEIFKTATWVKVFVPVISSWSHAHHKYLVTVYCFQFQMAYTPGLDRKRAYMLELLLNLPANSTTTISFEIEKLFLKWTEYLPDANFGFYIPAAIITAVLPDVPRDTTIQTMKEGYGVVRLYTEKLIVLLPTPDFSMPYNVICLACTVVALAFGSWYNLSTKTMIRLNNPPTPFLKKVIAKIKAKLFGSGKIEEQSKEKQPDSSKSTSDVDNDKPSELETKDEEPKPKSE